MNSCGGLLLFGPRSRDEPRPDTDHVRFLSVMIAIVLAGMLLVRCAGPTAAMLFADDECGLLRDTVSWKSLRFAWRALLMSCTTLAALSLMATRELYVVGTCLFPTFCLSHSCPEKRQSRHKATC